VGKLRRGESAGAEWKRAGTRMSTGALN